MPAPDTNRSAFDSLSRRAASSAPRRNAVSKDNAAADHDGVDGCAVLAEHQLQQRRAQWHDMRAFQPQDHIVGTV
jgi:hypothetical protein